MRTHREPAPRTTVHAPRLAPVARGVEPKKLVARALSVGGRPVRRLGSAGTSVTFAFLDYPERSVTLLLDRQPPRVVDGSESAEITITLDRRQTESFLAGELVLPNCVLRGEVTYSGPVRKYLPFDPVLRALLRRAGRRSM